MRGRGGERESNMEAPPRGGTRLDLLWPTSQSSLGAWQTAMTSRRGCHRKNRRCRCRPVANPYQGGHEQRQGPPLKNDAA